MKMLKNIVAASLCAVLSCSVFAYDFGFLVDNDTAFKSDSAKKMYLNQKDTVTGWIKVPFGQNYNNYFVAEGLYKFEYNANKNIVKNFIDLNLCKAVVIKELENGTVETNVGRFFYVDASGIIYSQNADGAFVKFSNGTVDVSGYAAYTGLLNSNLVRMINANGVKDGDDKKVYSLAEKYVVAIVTGSFPFLFAGQSLTVQGSGAFRINENTFNRMYATLSLNGPIAGNLFYNISGTAGFISVKEKDLEVSPLVKGDITYYFPSASAGLNCVFAGKNFTGITSQTALNSYSEPEYSNLLKAGLFTTVKPYSNLLLSVSADSAFDGNKNFEFKGFQYSAAVEYQIVSDVLVSAGWCQYFDMNKSDKDAMCADIRAKISF